ncbi:MAG: hypothetical protein R3C60_03280 [Parvularculaceae bacterium]
MIAEILTQLSHNAIALISLAAILFAATAASLFRLKSIGAFDLENRGRRKKAQGENIAHSLAKLAFSTILIGAAARFILAPDYPNGAFSIDGALVASGLINLATAIPFVGFIALLSRAETRKPAFIIPAAIAAAVIGGAGQMLTASAAAAKPLLQLLAEWRALALPAISVGIALALGIALHHMVMMKLVRAPRVNLALVITDAAIAAIPTILAIALAAAALASVLHVAIP